MSSPFNSLRKNKSNKVPLFPGHMAGNRPINFRHPEYSEDESRLLEEITSHMVQEKSRMQNPFVGIPEMDSPNPSLTVRDDGIKINRDLSVPTDQELMQSMMRKITFLEQKTTSQENELRGKDKRIKVLEEKLSMIEKHRKEPTDMSAFERLETHCLLLQQQVHEMETFLSEYGMVWVGEGNDTSDVYINQDVDFNDAEKTINASESVGGDTNPHCVSRDSSFNTNPYGIWRQATSTTDELGPFLVDFNKLVENIKDLNVLAGEGVAQIKKTADGARFEVPESVQLSIYSNGIILFEGPFRPYSDPTTRQCVQDLLDGYFPSELQSRYPDGVPFVVTDLRGTKFERSTSMPSFAGEGQTLGGETKPSRLIPTNYRSPIKTQNSSTDTQNLPTTSKLPGKQMTTTQFLSKLPKSIIRNGKVIDVRESVGKTLTGTDNNKPGPAVTVINTKVTQEMNESLSRSNSATRSNPIRCHDNVSTLRVLTESGEDTYIVKMKFNETIGDLRTYLDAQRRAKAPYDIVSTFPHKLHKNNRLTLQESGLTPNAVIHLKSCI